MSSTQSYYMFLFYCYPDHRALHSFPTRRSSDLRLESVKTRLSTEFRCAWAALSMLPRSVTACWWTRSEEHTSELQSRGHLVCRLLLEKKNDVQAALSSDDIQTLD